MSWFVTKFKKTKKINLGGFLYRKRYYKIFPKKSLYVKLHATVTRIYFL